jgi:hypothetical protein
MGGGAVRTRTRNPPTTEPGRTTFNQAFGAGPFQTPVEVSVSFPSAPRVENTGAQDVRGPDDGTSSPVRTPAVGPDTSNITAPGGPSTGNGRRTDWAKVKGERNERRKKRRKKDPAGVQEVVPERREEEL